MWLAGGLVAVLACAPGAEGEASHSNDSQGEAAQPASLPSADVIAVETTIVRDDATGQRVRFAVTVRSDDTGCDRYADWWEIVSLDGTLLQRRILAHSHVDEQPFERSAPPIEVALDQTVLVRAHLHPSGYVGQALQGSVEGGWEPVTSNILAPDLDQTEPLPDGCRF